MPLFITEFSTAAIDSRHNNIAIPFTPSKAEQRLDIEPVSQRSDPWGETTTFIMISATEPCCLAFGKEPEADPAYHMVHAGERLYYGVSPGECLAVIASGD